MPQLFALLVATTVACSAAAQSSHLPTEAKDRILRAAADALRDGDITRAQHADLVRWTSQVPCKNVKMKVPKTREVAIADAISEVQQFPNSRILEYFEAGGWYSVFTNAGSGDEQYLVYDRDPASPTKPRVSLSGAATIFETTEIRDWLLKMAPDMPRTLANCLAWQVTLGQ